MTKSFIHIKIAPMKRKIVKASFIVLFAVASMSCTSRKTTETQVQENIAECPAVEETKTEPVVEEIKEEPKAAEEKKVEPEPEPVVEEVKKEVEPEPVVKEVEEPPVVEEVPEETPAPAEEEQDESDKEYERSTANVSVSKEVFYDDKAKVLNMIKDLDTYMKNQDFKGWISCLDDESRNYWSRKQNLQKASNRLPRKLPLNTIEDYFKFVFIPSRANRSVEEIRYETETRVKAVQVEGGTDIIYYNFNKVNGSWKLNLPKNPD